MGKRAMLCIVLGLALPACGSKATCEDVADHLVEVAKKHGAEDLPGGKAKVVETCKEQKWPEDVRKCVVKASSEDQFGECLAKLPAFQEYTAKSKTTEAREFVKKLYDGARAYYMDPSLASVSISGEVAPPQFPTPSAGPTPPLGACCKQGGTCAPDSQLWQNNPWMALMFSVDDPHYYSYQYEVVDPHKKFVVRAFGDLDCDGVYSTFEMTGEIDAEHPDGPAGSPEQVRENELE